MSRAWRIRELVKVFIDSTPRANIYVYEKDEGIPGQTGSGDALKR